jgi:hypothetical protein
MVIRGVGKTLEGGREVERKIEKFLDYLKMYFLRILSQYRLNLKIYINPPKSSHSNTT